jgi:hypothetical protein
MILHILKAQKNTDAHRLGSVHIAPGDSAVQERRLAVSDLRPGGARPVDEGNAADQSGSWARAVLICRIALIRRGMPRQVARGALSVSFRVFCGRLTPWIWPTINNDVTNHEGRQAGTAGSASTV